MEKKELELYIHIPFCVKKCAYCDFLSFCADEKTQQSYVEALKKEIRFYGDYFQDRKLVTVFIGGGTPSWLDGTQIREILDTVYSVFCVEEDTEITIECNPGTVTAQKFDDYKAAGINRLSIGLQSASNEELQLLGRIHTFEQFLKMYDLARKKGFTNINIDLMSSLPGQTIESFEKTLRTVLKLKPEHISAYSLIIEEGTPFYERYQEDAKRQAEGEPTVWLPSEEEEYAITKLTQKLLQEAGYHWYEISNFAKPGYECRHNIGYWKRADYLGVGLGAASLIDNVRYANTRDLYGYLEACRHIYADDAARSESENCDVTGDKTVFPASDCRNNKDESTDTEIRKINLHETAERLTRAEQMEEFMFLGMRMLDGIRRSEFEWNFGTTVEAVYGDVLRKLTEEGLLQKQEGRLFLTEKGMDINNYVVEQFML